ncbi:MAG: YfhO family protein [Oscillospiraceae bacterium]|nr:YfhO family protein [Oscillospiraceae bacterium]
MIESSLQKPRERTLAAFLLALCTATAMFLPFLIIDKGYFIFYGDFNVQQIPFYQMAHDAVRSGNIFWNWTTDLGANFIGSYSFYLLGSPFFLITLLFPSAVVPLLMAPLLILKFALSSLAAYLYLRRFLRPDYALLGGLLYAFSGFSIYNIFFNHFHEAIVYFPLMLLAMEMYMNDGKKGLFGVTVFLSALCNYYFFIGQAIFLIIYWIIRAISGGWQRTGIRFFGLLFEAVIGTAGASILLLPSYLAVSQNPRTDNILAGWNLLLYTKPQRILDIIHSFFFPQDIPARAAFFPGSDNKWSSMSAWLPVFSCTGVIAYLQSRRHKDWIRRLIIALIIIALVPVFNAMFQLFNSMYYARWYYMMVLIFALATMRAIQDEDEIVINWKRALGWTAGVCTTFALIVGFAPVSWQPDEETGRIVFGLYNKDYPEFFWIAVAIAAVSLILVSLLIALHRRERDLFFKWSVGVTVSVILIFGWYSIGVGKVQGRYSSRYIVERVIKGANKINLPNDGFARVDFNNDLDNLGMFWQMPTIQAFHSIVPGSVMEFYPTVGVERNVGSRPDTSHHVLRGLLSVRWLFDYANDDNLQSKSESSYFTQTDEYDNETKKMPGWSYYDEQNGYFIYQNDEYIPPGFTYDMYMTRTQYDSMDKNSREFSLLKAIVLEDKDAKKYGKYLEQFDKDNYFSSLYDESEYFEDCRARRATSASSFEYDNRGFSATISLNEDNLVFFSVPYESGWSAKVNGKKAEILRANVGFMAVLCPAGEDVSIRFDYMTPGLKLGALISLAAVLVFAAYMVIVILVNRRRARKIGNEVAVPPKLPGEKHEDTISDDGFNLYDYYPGTKPDN